MKHIYILFISGYLQTLFEHFLYYVICTGNAPTHSTKEPSERGNIRTQKMAPSTDIVTSKLNDTWVLDCEKNISVNIFIPIQYFKHLNLISSQSSGF